jgi:5,5'-dehydrodivanillate O-demethylase oxygenase subunit
MAVTERRTPARVVSTARKPRYDVDLATTKPGTPGGIFMRQFWHAVARSDDLAPGRALPLRIMNEDYTLFRGTGGRAQVIAQRCPHRGSLMHLGWVENDDIRCVYHGWKYDGSGSAWRRRPKRKALHKT